ncbi:dipeptidase PepE [Alteromonas sp. ASW11-130]|uniref:dipeptidase PepE n=1 Tax=Alteromonas sp. ASW11-130 TaxID=3015775 RepID=UPI00224232A2|nr:dipeptidase PepE [Alteromonas sp. ASW11-130]MCW8091369.1 dipeptidase PepE [Alteromonas sp. ASW11-130]
MTSHVLMLSSSRAGNEEYLEHAKQPILSHLGERREVLFVPFAGVSIGWDEYTQKVQTALPECNVIGLHTFAEPLRAVLESDANNQAILVGGGNTFHLLATLYHHGLVEPLRQVIGGGTPYIGWSAGSNICGATIRTTNDMPIIEPPSFNALNILPCQINPHYTDFHPPGHNGETRDDRLQEFTRLNPTTPVIAIREGTALLLSKGTLSLEGTNDGFVFLGESKTTIKAGQDLTEYLR